MRTMLEHPEIGWIERTGYPSWMQETEHEDDDYGQDAYCDRCYEEARERALFGDD